MRVVCIDNKGLEKYLTIGKFYNIIKIDDDGDYWIIDDVNDILCFPKKYFKTLSEIRTEKINKLLGL